MMDELDLLKKDWQSREKDLPRLSYEKIYKMIRKKSSSIVKWIFFISVMEFVFWAAINLINYSEESRELEKQWHIQNLSTALTVINYVVLIYFIVRFYLNYKQITITDSSRKLMKSILKVKRTVTQYVWFNIGIFCVSLVMLLYGSLTYGEESEKIMAAAEAAGNQILFWVMLIGLCVIIIGIILLLIWLFYRLLYGILLKRLRQNYAELKKLEF
ncbi:hypothetical protein [Lentiprolixibacter aurantiacus]|uniref:Beta-carotene 15,15'-monooxygenase n=1 Tax=Lentiprolixibacter aurantiacus TaxID=2993939 RepID=A0AAE3SP97_9FLAO|nr:hypothetical protein [Lentiprolixibacter aurantiacus]MCX2719986.1 hypothetical protein [Lentiprolixibacter aurantiacus]